jgi:transketolase
VDEVRLDVLDMVYRAGSGHIDSSFSVTEILVVLYFAVMRVEPSRPEWPARDRLVLSKGHAAPVLYACLARRGFFPHAQLARLRRVESHLQGHPDLATPGVDAPTGSLGQGLSLASGMAYAARCSAGASFPSRVFAIISDGELNEGQTWEALMLSGHLRLANLTLAIDLNGLQFSGACREVLAVGNLRGALNALGWDCTAVDGHSTDDLCRAFSRAGGRPHAVLASTTKGRGVSFMENDLSWHGRVPNEAEYRAARGQLRASLARNA